MTAKANILVVEDEFLVAMQIEAVLREAGWSVTGPAGTLANAVKLARCAACDGAVLDVNLRGERVDEVATILSERDIPFLFVSGYGRENLPQAFRDNTECLVKPCSDQTLVRAVRDLLMREKKVF
jgi:DNA-binding response OmpR family regulator